MNVESSTATLLMRAQQEPAQPPRPQFTTKNLNAWLVLCAAVSDKVAARFVEIRRILNDTTLTPEGQTKKLAVLGEQIVREFQFVADPLKDVVAATERLTKIMLDPITAKPKGDPTVIFLSEQEIRSGIPKDEATIAFLRSLETDNVDVARSLLNAPGGSWIDADVRRRGEEEYARRTNPAAWEEVQSLAYFQEHLESLVTQVRQWFQALGVSPVSIDKALGE